MFREAIRTKYDTDYIWTIPTAENVNVLVIILITKIKSHDPK